MVRQNHARFGIVVALLITGAGLRVGRYLHRSFQDRLRKKLHEAAAAGVLPKELQGVDLDTVPLEGFQIRLSDSEYNRLKAADMLSHLWFIWVPLVFAGCAGLAFLIGDRKGP